MPVISAAASCELSDTLAIAGASAQSRRTRKRSGPPRERNGKSRPCPSSLSSPRSIPVPSTPALRLQAPIAGQPGTPPKTARSGRMNKLPAASATEARDKLGVIILMPTRQPCTAAATFTILVRLARRDHADGRVWWPQGDLVRLRMPPNYPTPPPWTSDGGVEGRTGPELTRRAECNASTPGTLGSEVSREVSRIKDLRFQHVRDERDTSHCSKKSKCPAKF
jgi:hypothetical protein